MKKCPECGNPSYDGAPVCGNCGYKFPKTRVAPPKREDIFEQAPKVKKSSNEKSTIEILKEKKLIIGLIVLLTILVICGILLTGSNNNDKNSPIQSGDSTEFSAGGFSFKYPKNWERMNLTDSEHEDAIFFKAGNNTFEYYNITSDSTLKEINQNRISYAQERGNAVDLLETIKIDNLDSSNFITESESGEFTRYVSILDNGILNVFKITGNSIDSVTSEEINNVVNSATIA